MTIHPGSYRIRGKPDIITIRQTTAKQFQRYLRLSQCGLYSMCVEGARFRILRNVSRIRLVLVVSVAVRFQMDSRSSGNCVESTTPHISGPTKNCSPSIAMQTFSHARSTLFFLNRMTHLPPRTFPGSSHMGFMPLCKCKWEGRWGYEFCHLQDVRILSEQQNNEKNISRWKH